MDQEVKLPSIEEEKKDSPLADLEVKIGELSARVEDLQGTVTNLMEEVAKKDRRIGSLEGQVKSLTAKQRESEDEITLSKDVIADKIAEKFVDRALTVRPIKKTAKTAVKSSQ